MVITTRSYSIDLGDYVQPCQALNFLISGDWVKQDILKGIIESDCMIKVPDKYVGMRYDLNVRAPLPDIEVWDIAGLPLYIQIIPAVIRELNDVPGISTRALAARLKVNYHTADNARALIERVHSGASFDVEEYRHKYVKIAPAVKKDLEADKHLTVYRVCVRYEVDRDTAKRALEYARVRIR